MIKFFHKISQLTVEKIKYGMVEKLNKLE